MAADLIAAVPYRAAAFTLARRNLRFNEVRPFEPKAVRAVLRAIAFRFEFVNRHRVVVDFRERFIERRHGRRTRSNDDEGENSEHYTYLLTVKELVAHDCVTMRQSLPARCSVRVIVPVSNARLPSTNAAKLSGTTMYARSPAWLKFLIGNALAFGLVSWL